MYEQLIQLMYAICQQLGSAASRPVSSMLCMPPRCHDAAVLRSWPIPAHPKPYGALDAKGARICSEILTGGAEGPQW